VFPFCANACIVLMMGFFKLWWLSLNIFAFGILFMSITLIMLNKNSSSSWIPYRFYHHFAIIRIYSKGSPFFCFVIIFLLIKKKICCLKFHLFMFAMPIMKLIIISLHFVNVQYLCKCFDLLYVYMLMPTS
jgi:hypothetical protein